MQIICKNIYACLERSITKKQYSSSDQNNQALSEFDVMSLYDYIWKIASSCVTTTREQQQQQRDYIS